MEHKRLLAVIDRLVGALCRVTIEGQENVPPTGAAIAAINHLGFLDPAVGYMAVRRADLTGWVADKHKTNPLYSYFIRSANGIWINRESVDMAALRQALQALKDGRIFGLAPEGTRSPTKAMLPAKEGASYLAIASGAPVIPAGIWGTEDSAGDWLRLRKPVIHLRFGKAFHLPPFNRETRQQDLERGTDEIMCRIAALIPEKYRGFYAEHPRLKELLAQGADQV